ncbi:hypothetical protein Pelo_17382 [Pelomyxa schiedti]|nr:hypothetical protein Pelo_17382 [Pelomyxa schiedti]
MMSYKIGDAEENNTQGSADGDDSSDGDDGGDGDGGSIIPSAPDVAVSTTIMARDQFVALATGATVARAGARSAVRLAAHNAAWLADFGREWVVGPTRQMSFWLHWASDGDCGHGRMPLCMSLSVSATLGVVGWGPEAVPEGVQLNWKISGNKFLGQRGPQFFIVERPRCSGLVGVGVGGVAAQEWRWGSSFYSADPGGQRWCGSKWIVISGSWSFVVWKLVGGVPHGVKSLPPLERNKKVFLLKDDIVVILETHLDHKFYFFDLPQSYEQNKLVLDGCRIAGPVFHPMNGLMVGKTLFSLHSRGGTLFSIWDSDRRIPSSFPPSFVPHFAGECILVSKEDYTEHRIYHPTERRLLGVISSLPMSDQWSLWAEGLIARMVGTHSAQMREYEIIDVLSRVTLVTIKIDTGSKPSISCTE